MRGDQMGQMDSQEDENAATGPDDDIDSTPDEGSISMPEEGEIYMPQEDIHEPMQYEGDMEYVETTTTTETHTAGVVTTEFTETSTHEGSVMYESEIVTTETEGVYDDEESYTEEAREVLTGEEEYYQEEGSYKSQEDYAHEQETGVDSASDGEGGHSYEESEVTAIEIDRNNEEERAETEEDEISKTGDEGEELKQEEESKPEEEVPKPEKIPPKPKEEPVKFDIVVKSEEGGKIELDTTLYKRTGQLWGFKMKGGRDLDFPPEISEVRAGSIAEKAGLKVEDMIVSINDENVFDYCHHHVSRTIIDSGDTLKLGLYRFSDPSASIQIKEAYKKVQVQVTEEYQLVEDDPTTLGVNVQQTEKGEYAVIVKGKVLDDEEVAMLSMSKMTHETKDVKSEATEIMINKQGEIREIRNEKTEFKSGGEAPIESAPPVESAQPVESAENAKPAENAPPAEAPAVQENMPTEGALKDLNLDNTHGLPSALPRLTGDYTPVTNEEADKSYELLIGKIHYVPPPERPINKCYFYKPREGDMRKVTWPPKSNISNVIIKPRIRREGEKERSIPPQPKKASKVAAPQQMSSVNQIAQDPIQSSPKAPPQMDSVPLSGSVGTKPISEGGTGAVAQYLRPFFRLCVLL